MLNEKLYYLNKKYENRAMVLTMLYKTKSLSEKRFTKLMKKLNDWYDDCYTKIGA